MLTGLTPRQRGRVLAEAGVDEIRLGTPSHRWPQADYFRLHHAAVRARDDELFGALRRPVPRGGFASLVDMLVRIPSPLDALRASNTFYGLFDGAPVWRVTVTATHVIAELRATSPRQATSVLYGHMMMQTPLAVLSWMVQHAVRPDRVWISEFMAPYARETTYLMGVVPEIRACNGWQVPLALMRLPVLRRAHEVRPWLETSLQDIVRPPRPSRIEERVRAYLASADPIGTPSLQDTAQHLGMSRASLVRRLHDGGLRFQGVKDTLRREVAERMLAHEGSTVVAVAHALGFADARSFRRAFRSWTGRAPRG